MNSIITQFEMACDEMMFDISQCFLEHEGVSVLDGAPIGSGRYRYGSGENAYQHKLEFYQMVNKIKKENPGIKYTEIAKMMNMGPNEYKAKMSNASAVAKTLRNKRIYELADKYPEMSHRQMEAETGIPESTIRKILAERGRVKLTKNQEIADQLKDCLTRHEMIDIGPGAELTLNCTRNRIDSAVALLEESGEFKRQMVYVDQMTGKGKTPMTILAPADYDYQNDILKNVDKIYPVTDKTIDADGNIMLGKRLNPASVDSKRIYVNYAEDGGIDSDGIIEIRPGCRDLDLGNSHYAQVRIAVDGTHYLKGVARYNDNIPEGYDIMVQSNKHRGTPLLGDKDNTVAKVMKDDPANPFGSSLKPEEKLSMVQKYYFDENGKQKLSALNIVNEEGDWEKWSKSIASQVLAKEDPKLTKRQLDLTLAQHRAELDSIKALTNPTVKQQLLEQFSNQADAAAKELKASPFPGQHTRLLLPINNQKDNECYCEDYPNGTTIYAIRYPHGGTFETAELVVNNNNKEAKKTMGGAVDGIGVTPATRARLSGADCDGDTVVVFPRSAGVVLKTGKLPKEMEGFDPHSYKLSEGAKKMSDDYKQIQMGITTNLITDMTVKIDERVRKRGYMTAEEENDIVRAVKLSMVIIDAPKHGLDWNAAKKDLGFRQLQKKYQYDPETGKAGGAATLLSRAKNEVDVHKRKSRTGIYTTNTNPETGEKIDREEPPYTKTDVDAKTGRVTIREGVYATQKSTQMDEAKDARKLSSGTLMESIYADYANGEKALANEARKEYLATKPNRVNPEARTKYKKEVESLTNQLIIAKKNAPLERHAVRLAAEVYKQACLDNPHMSKDDKKKLRGRLMTNARTAVGAGKTKINISDKEWEAIQEGAISHNTLVSILKNADSKQVRQLATPRNNDSGLTDTQKSTIARMVSDRGYTREEAAEALGISVNQVNYVMSQVYSKN